MDDHVENISVSNELLSQSYCKGLKRITGATQGILLDFPKAKELLCQRKQNWNNFFQKYSEEFLDDIELSINNFSLESNASDTISLKELPCDLSIHKRQQIQHWINTRHSPYTLCMYEKSVADSLLFEEQSSSSRCPVLVSNGNQECNGKQKQVDSTSCSTVDTAVYIMSNANITKKEQVLAIIEGARDSDLSFPMHILCTSTRTTPHCRDKMLDIHKDLLCTDNIRNEDFSSASALDSRLMTNKCTKTDDDACFSTDSVKATNVELEKRLDIHFCSLRDKQNVKEQRKYLDTNNVPTSTCHPIDNVMKHLHINNSDNTQSEEDLGAQLLSDDEIFMVSSNCDSSNSLRLSHWKKLYTGRASPVDLTPPKRLSLNRISQGEKSLHPALDPNAQNVVRQKRFKRKRKRVSLLNETKSGFQLNDCLADSAESCDDNTQSSAYDMADSVTFGCAQIFSPPPLKSNKLPLNADDIISEQLKYIAIRENTSLNTSINTMKGSAILMNGKTVLKSPKSIDVPRPVGQSEPAKENSVESDAPIIVQTTPKPTDTERESIIRADTPNLICTKNGDATNNSKSSKSFICEVQNLDPDTVDSDQSTILLCECKTREPHVCGNDNLSTTDSDSHDNVPLPNAVPLIITRNDHPVQNMNPVVLLTRLDNRILEKKDIASKGVSDNVNEAPLDVKSFLHDETHKKLNLRKRRKIEPVAVLKNLNLTLPSRRSLNKKRASGTNGNFDKLFVDFNGSSPVKNRDKNGIDKRIKEVPVVVLEKLEFKDNVSIMANQLSDRRSVNTERVDVAGNQLANTPESNVKSVEVKLRRESTRLSEQTAKNVKNCISYNTPLAPTRFSRKRRNKNRLRFIPLSEPEDSLTVLMRGSEHVESNSSKGISTSKTLQPAINIPVKISNEHRDGLCHSTGKKSITPSSTSSSVKGIKRPRSTPLLVRRTEIVKFSDPPSVLNNNRATLRSNSLAKNKPTFASSSLTCSARRSDNIPSLLRSSKKLLNSFKNDDMPSDATDLKSIPNRPVQSVYFRTKLYSDSESGLSVSCSTRSSVKRNSRKSRGYFNLNKSNAVDSSNCSTKTQERSFKIVPKERNRSIVKLFQSLDTSDEEDESSLLTRLTRERKNESGSLPEASQLQDTPAKRTHLRKRRATITYHKRPVYSNKANDLWKDINEVKARSSYKNLKPTATKIILKRTIKEPSKDGKTNGRKIKIFQTKKYYEVDSPDVSS